MREFVEKLSQIYNDIFSFVLKVLTDAGVDTSNIPEWLIVQPIAE